MMTTRLVLVALLLSSALPLRAEVRIGKEPPDASAERGPSCPCDRSDFKPLNDKARAVAEYWRVRRKYRVASSIAGTVGLFGILAQHAGAMNEAQNALTNAASELDAARAKALSLQGIKVIDGDDKNVEILLKKDIDYALAP